MKKNKKWLRDRYEQMETIKITTKNSRGSRSNSYIKKKTAINLLNQLDEPETLSQEWIDEHKKSWQDLSITGYSVPESALQNLLVPRQEEVDPETVASVIADFYKSLERLREVLGMEVEELEE